MEDIRAQEYNVNEYPPSDDFLCDANSVIPESLQLFLESVIILKHKRGPLEKWKKKCVALAHVVISAVRPRSFISSLLTGISAYMYRKFGSKHLVNLLSALGFAAAYNEAALLESSAILRQNNSVIIEKDAFLQFAFDNADFNVNTIDGLGTFHAMGGIVCVNPHTAVLPDEKIPRLKRRVPSEEIALVGSVELRKFCKKKNSGLSTIPVMDVQGMCSFAEEILPSAPDLVRCV